MTCLGWKTRAECKTRPDVQLTPDAVACPDITWFYLAAAAIGVLAMMKSPGGTKGALESL